MVLPAAPAPSPVCRRRQLTDANVEDLIGQIVTDPITEITTFISEAGTIENAEGSLGDDTIRGTAGTNFLTANLSGGNDLLDGRGGDDTAVFRGNIADYVISANSDGSYTVQDTEVNSRDGTDKVFNIEHLQFAMDGTVDTGFAALNDSLSVTGWTGVNA